MIFFFLSLEPPNGPQNVNAISITSNSATVIWNGSDSPGTGGPVQYKIVCNSCSGETVYTKNETRLNFTLSGLNSNTEYNISVIAVNNVTRLVGYWISVNVAFRTKPKSTLIFIFLKYQFETCTL